MTRAKPKASRSIENSQPIQNAQTSVEAGYEENQRRVSAPVHSGATVTVGCKIPNGIVMQLQQEEEVNLPVLGGGFKSVKENRPHPSAPTYTLFGNKTPIGHAPRCLIVGGFAMTPGLPKDFVVKWFDQNKNLDLVKAGLIIFRDTTDEARANAKEHSGLRSGLEAISPGNDPRIPKRPNKDGKFVDAIETGDEQPVSKVA